MGESAAAPPARARLGAAEGLLASPFLSFHGGDPFHPGIYLGKDPSLSRFAPAPAPCATPPHLAGRGPPRRSAARAVDRRRGGGAGCGAADAPARGAARERREPGRGRGQHAAQDARGAQLLGGARPGLWRGCAGPPGRPLLLRFMLLWRRVSVNNVLLLGVGFAALGLLAEPLPAEGAFVSCKRLGQPPRHSHLSRALSFSAVTHRQPPHRTSTRARASASPSAAARPALPSPPRAARWRPCPCPRTRGRTGLSADRLATAAGSRGRTRRPPGRWRTRCGRRTDRRGIRPGVGHTLVHRTRVALS